MDFVVGLSALPGLLSAMGISYELCIMDCRVR